MLRHSPALVTDGHVFYFDAANPRCHTSGATSKDLSANKLTITWNTAPVVNTSNLGSVATNVQAWASTTVTVLPSNGYSPLSMEAWVMQTNSSPVWQTFIGTANQFTQIGAFAGTFAVGRDGGGGGLIVTGLRTITANTWYSFGMVYDGNTNNTVSAYVNGNCIATGQNIGFRTGTINGPHYIGVFTTQSEWFNGNIAIAKVYNRALSNTEMRQNFDAHRGRFNL